MSKPKLGYWKIRGLAQPARLMLNYVGQDFEDVQYEQGDAPEYSRAAWEKVKPTLGLDFPNLPYYIDGDIKITQSNAILRFIAGKHGLLGKTDKEKAYADMMLENAMDFRNGLVRVVYNDKYDELLPEYEKNVKTTLAGFNKFLSDKKFFAGDNVTVADFPMYELLDQHTLMIKGCLNDYPHLQAFLKRFEDLPKIKAYMASPKFIKRPINNKSAKFK
uniref:glutathione transferase n=1 Tax=Reishia clavigera TaxID=272940 RepID=B5L7D7_REICL|nr:glutathione S-transferase mu [Reishia clavigera]